jgi:predicted ester cyclase
MSSATLVPPAAGPALPRINSRKEVVRRFFEDVLTRKSETAIDELIAPDATVSLPTGRYRGPQAVNRGIVQLHTAFTNLRIEVKTIIAEGDRIAAEWTMCGTERGELLGVPPSGRRVCLSGLSLTRVKGHRIVEHRMVGD